MQSSEDSVSAEVNASNETTTPLSKPIPADLSRSFKSVTESSGEGSDPMLSTSSPAGVRGPPLNTTFSLGRRTFYDALNDESAMVVLTKEREFRLVPQFTGTLRRPGEEPLYALPENVTQAIHRSLGSASALHSDDNEDKKSCKEKKTQRGLEKKGMASKCYGVCTCCCFPFVFLKDKVVSKLRSYIRYLMTTPKATEWSIWDICLRCLDIYYLFIIPTMFAFSCEFDESFLLHFMLFDVLYILRVVFNFIRPVYNEYGDLITDYRGIRAYYFRRPTGTIEVFGSIPFDWVILFISFARGTYYDDFTCKQPWFCYADGTCSKRDLGISGGSVRINKLFSTLSTLRWLYFLKLERFINGPILKIIKNLLTWQLFSHLDACIFWLIETSIDSSHRFIEVHEMVHDQEGHPTSFLYRFIANFHTAQKSLFFLQREVKVLQEYIFQAVEALVSAVIFGSTLGNLNSIMRLFNSEAALDKAAKERNFKIKYLSNYMIQHKFPSTLQKRIVEQEEFEWVHRRGMDTNRLFNELPKSMRLEVSVHLYYELISKVPIFKNVEEIFKVALCERVSTITVRKGFYICKVGDPGTEMYFLKSGSVEILTKDEATCIATLRSGSFFGEIALFEDCRRTATIKTLEDSQLCVLRKNDFNEILTEYPELVEIFRAAVAERQNKDQKRKQEESEQQKKREKEKLEKQEKLKVGGGESDSIRSSANLATSALLATRRFGEGIRKGLTRSVVNPPTSSVSAMKKEKHHDEEAASEKVEEEKKS